jgi:hypothetical protein
MTVPFIVIRKVDDRWNWVCLACSLGGTTYFGGTKSFTHTASNVRRHCRVRYCHHRWVFGDERRCRAVEMYYEREGE